MGDARPRTAVTNGHGNGVPYVATIRSTGRRIRYRVRFLARHLFLRNSRDTRQRTVWRRRNALVVTLMIDTDFERILLPSRSGFFVSSGRVVAGLRCTRVRRVGVGDGSREPFRPADSSGLCRCRRSRRDARARTHTHTQRGARAHEHALRDDGDGERWRYSR